MIKLAMNQNTYNRLADYDENTFYFIDNTLKDGEIKNCDNYLLSDEVAAVRTKILESGEIDGIDVSGCECSSQIDLDVNIICTSNFPSKKSGYCKDNPNCCFKQLSCKTQECKELKKANDEKNELLAKLGCPTTATAKMKAHCLQEQLDQLKVEKEQAEQKLKRIREFATALCYTVMSDGVVILQKDILKIIDEVKR